MLRSILHITGLEQKLEAVRDRIEGQAQSLMQHSKAVAVQMAIASALAVGAAIIGLMALVAALITLFFWLEPQMGSIAAMGLIAAGLLVIGMILAVCAAMIGRKETPRQPIAATRPAATADIAATRMAEAKLDTFGRDPLSRDHIGLGDFQPARPVTAEEVESLFAVAGQFTRLPHTGIESVDNMVRSLAPKAEEATREAVARAANLVRHGDRSTVLTILGTALAIGWAMTKIDHLSKAKPV
jgi:uncharacterized membrane protein YqjE